jgi:hypothetical protein
MTEVIDWVMVLAWYFSPAIGAFFLVGWICRKGGLPWFLAGLLALGVASLVGAAIWLQLLEFAGDTT